MKLVFDDQAIADLENIFGWIAQDSPTIARSVTDRLFSSMELLISFPFIGDVGRDPDGWFRGCLILWCTRLIECKSESS